MLCSCYDDDDDDDDESAFMPPGHEMIEVISNCLPHRQLWTIVQGRYAAAWGRFEPATLRLGYKAQSMSIPLHHHIPMSVSLYESVIKLENALELLLDA